jgi:predicted ribosome-associated RNA-binding protein Tma20
MSINLKEGVEKFIYNGANLMWPGVASVDGPFLAD